jgi:hypothetical protein
MVEPIVDESGKTVKQIVVEAPFRENLLVSLLYREMTPLLKYEFDD